MRSWCCGIGTGASSTEWRDPCGRIRTRCGPQQEIRGPLTPLLWMRVDLRRPFTVPGEDDER